MRRRTRRFLLIFFMLSLSIALPLAANADGMDLTPRIHILIDPGHGGIDGGAASDQVLEKNVNLAVGIKLQQELNKRGYHVILTRDKDEALSDSSPRDIGSRHQRDLVQRGDIANYFYPQLVISLHVNSGSKAGTGTLVLYQKNGQSFLLAHILQHKLNLVTGKKREPVMRKDLFILNQTRSISSIVEVGFISNPDERALLIQPGYQEKIAKSIAEGIDEFIFIFPWYINR